jgi:hypothetical protein
MAAGTPLVQPADMRLPGTDRCDRRWGFVRPQYRRGACRHAGTDPDQPVRLRELGDAGRAAVFARYTGRGDGP